MPRKKRLMQAALLHSFLLSSVGRKGLSLLVQAAGQKCHYYIVKELDYYTMALLFRLHTPANACTRLHAVAISAGGKNRSLPSVCAGGG